MATAEIIPAPSPATVPVLLQTEMVAVQATLPADVPAATRVATGPVPRTSGAASALVRPVRPTTGLPVLLRPTTGQETRA